MVLKAAGWKERKSPEDCFLMILIRNLQAGFFSTEDSSIKSNLRWCIAINLLCLYSKKSPCGGGSSQKTTFSHALSRRSDSGDGCIHRLHRILSLLFANQIFVQFCCMVFVKLWNSCVLKIFIITFRIPVPAASAGNSCCGW